MDFPDLCGIYQENTVMVTVNSLCEMLSRKSRFYWKNFEIGKTISQTKLLVLPIKKSFWYICYFSLWDFIQVSFVYQSTMLLMLSLIPYFAFWSCVCCCRNCHYALKDLELSFISLARVSLNKEDGGRSYPCMTTDIFFSSRI